MLNQTHAKELEEEPFFLQFNQGRFSSRWTRTQQRLLETLQGLEDKNTSIREICQLAGYSGSSIWREAVKDERFVAAIQALGLICSHNGLRRYQQRLLAVLQHPENRTLPGAQISRLAGYKTAVPWQRAIKDERFVAAIASLGVVIRRHHLPPHLEIEQAYNIEEELAKDVWDMRRLKHDYPKHVAPSTFEVDFSGIINPFLRE